MKFVVTLLLSLLLLACSSTKPGPVRTVPDVTSVEVWREFSITLHADTEFTDAGRARIRESAEKWRVASAGRIRIDVQFDLDFDSVEGLKAHQAAKHSLLVGIMSDYPIAQRIDELLGGRGRVPLAATLTGDENTLVFLIVDRIAVDDFVSVVTHELGHVAGLPDLPTFGSVMSGTRFRGDDSVNELTREDLVLCRGARLCP